VKQDYVEAYAWHDLAATTFEGAAKSRDALEKLMSPPQLAAGKKRAEELQALVDAKLKGHAK
jgi:hypothetical protein